MLPYPVQRIQNERITEQHPQHTQHRQQCDAAYNGRGCIDIRGVAVVQIVHGGQPQGQRPELLQSGHEQHRSAQLIKERGQQQGKFSLLQRAAGGTAQPGVVRVAPAEGGKKLSHWETNLSVFERPPRRIFAHDFKIVFLLQFNTKSGKIKCAELPNFTVILHRMPKCIPAAWFLAACAAQRPALPVQSLSVKNLTDVDSHGLL